MRYTTDDQGVMNNYALEPKTYFAEQPSKQQQIRYAIQGGLAITLLTALIAVAMKVS
jgi:hypothetical protein